MEENVHFNKIYVDKKNDFFEIFNPDNGTLIRSNVCGTDKNPLKRSFPELIDIGIMGNCKAGRTGICKMAGIDCYQNGLNVNNQNMSLRDYEWIVDQCGGKVFQVALGGAGDPNKHENFDEILELTRRNGIVPNLTTSGTDITDNELYLIKKYCGAVAVSFYSRLIGERETNSKTIEVISKCVKEDCVTNIHYVISTETIDEAIYRLENEIWPKGINAIIFLLYKPVGLGRKQKVITFGDKLFKFLNLAINKRHDYRVGFDTCFSTALFRMSVINKMSIDTCEASRFSMYIHSDLIATPCSFDNIERRYAFKLKPKTIKDAWESEEFSSFAKNQENINCLECSEYGECLGGCKLKLGINLC